MSGASSDRLRIWDIRGCVTCPRWGQFSEVRNLAGPGHPLESNRHGHQPGDAGDPTRFDRLLFLLCGADALTPSGFACEINLAFDGVVDPAEITENFYKNIQFFRQTFPSIASLLLLGHVRLFRKTDIWSAYGRVITVSRYSFVGSLPSLSYAYSKLADAETIPDVKSIRDKAESVRNYAKNAKLGLELQNQAAELKIRAERKAGKLIASLKLRGGNRKSKLHRATLKSLTLENLGVGKNQSARWQLIASIPDKEFEARWKASKSDNRELKLARGLGDA